MEDVTTGQFLGGSSCGSHLLPADDAYVVSVGQLLRCGVRIEMVHVVDGAARQNNIIECFFERSHGEVHGSDSEEWQSVDPDHDHEEEDVEEDLDEAYEEFSVEHEDSLVLPGVLAVQVNGVEDILDEGVDDNGEEDGILETKHQLNTGSLQTRDFIKIDDYIFTKPTLVSVEV